ncbi:MAG: DUF4345 family protein [Pseudomonadota bacterium]
MARSGQVLLFVNALAFISFGVYALLYTGELATLLGADAIGVGGLYELRSNYGGVSIGAGVLLLIGALNTRWRRAALVFLLTYMGGYVVGRTSALAFGAWPPSQLLAFGAFEAVMAMLALLCLRATSAAPADADTR